MPQELVCKTDTNNDWHSHAISFGVKNRCFNQRFNLKINEETG